MSIHPVQTCVYALEAAIYLVFERCEPFDSAFRQPFDHRQFHSHFSIGFDGL
jgi:hypothetical protein